MAGEIQQQSHPSYVILLVMVSPAANIVRRNINQRCRCLPVARLPDGLNNALRLLEKLKIKVEVISFPETPSRSEPSGTSDSQIWLTSKCVKITNTDSHYVSVRGVGLRATYSSEIAGSGHGPRHKLLCSSPPSHGDAPDDLEETYAATPCGITRRNFAGPSPEARGSGKVQITASQISSSTTTMH